MSILTIEEAREFARDMETSDPEMTSYIAAAEDYIVNAVGERVDKANASVKILAGNLVAEMVGVRGLTSAEKTSRSRLVESIICQLQAKYGGVAP